MFHGCDVCSLRNGVYLCEDCTGYIQLYFPVQLSDALSRNSHRQSPVPDDVITTMADRLDVPSESNTWERRTCSWTDEDQTASNL